MTFQWEIAPVLVTSFGMSRSQVRRALADGAFTIARGTWERLPNDPEAVFESDGTPAVGKIRYGKRDVRLVVLR